MDKVRVGLLIDTFEDLCEHEICKGIFNYFTSVGIHIILFEGAYNFRSINPEDQYLKTTNMIKNSDLSGIIIFSSFFLDHIDMEKLTKYISSINQIPVVSVGLKIDGVSSVYISEDSAISQLIDYLVKEENHQNFAFMFGPKNDKTSESRLNIFKKNLKRYSIDVYDNKIYKLESSNYYDAKLETKNLLAQCITIPEVIICYDDYTALGVVNYLEDEGFSVPFDIKVTGFDNIPIENPFKTKLITIKQPFKEVGTEAAKILCQKIQNSSLLKSIKLDCEVITNNATPYYKTLIDWGKNDEFDFSKLNSIEYTKEIIQSVIEKITVNNIKTKDSLLDMFYTMTIDEFIEDPLSLNKHLKNYLKGSSVDTISEVKHILDTGLQIIYNDFGIGTIIYRIFSTSLHAINEYLLNSIVSERYIREDFYWREAVGSQVILRCDTFDDLISSLPVYTQEFQCEEFYLFLYRYNNKSVQETELVFSSRTLDNKIPQIFNSKSILPDWELISKDHNYIIVMLFYNEFPIGYMFIDYSPGIDPKKYSAMRINLETAIFNIMKLEDEKNLRSTVKNNYIENFAIITNIHQEVVNKYNSLNSKTCSEDLVSLGSSLNTLTATISDGLNLEQDLIYYDHNQISYLSFPGCLTTEIISFDPEALESILTFLKRDDLKLISSKLNKVENSVILYINYRGNNPFREDDYEYSRIRDILNRGKGSIEITQNDRDFLVLLTFKAPYINPIYYEAEDKSLVVVYIDEDKYILDTLNINFATIYYQSITFLKPEKIPQNSIILSRFPDIRGNSFKEKVEKYEHLIASGFPVIFFSSKRSLKEKRKSLNIGAIDYLEMPFSSELLNIKLKNIFSVITKHKRRYISLIEKTLQGVLESESLNYDIKRNKTAESLESLYNLNSRELEIAQLLANKKSHREIASKINLTEQSVRNISHKLYKKCGVKGKKELLGLMESLG